MPESSDALLFVAWGETDLASAPFGGVGEAGGRVARTPATGYCLRSCGYSFYGFDVKPTSLAGPRLKSLSSRSKHGSAHNCSWHPGQSREWWVGKIFSVALTLEHCVASRDGNPFKKISAHEGKRKSSKT